MQSQCFTEHPSNFTDEPYISVDICPSCREFPWNCRCQNCVGEMPVESWQEIYCPLCESPTGKMGWGESPKYDTVACDACRVWEAKMRKTEPVTMGSHVTEEMLEETAQQYDEDCLRYGWDQHS